MINKKMKISRENNYRINLGIELLRMILCFWVIIFHYGGKKLKKRKILNTFFHVPTFMIISFYMSSKLFFTQNLIKIKQRLIKLIIPFIIIPIIDLGIKISFSLFKTTVNIKKILFNLFLQYITGYKTYVILWFVQILLIFTIFFEIIFLCFHKKTLFILQLLIIMSYWIQYSEINFKLFYNYKKYLRSVSHIAEMIPLASTGITLGFIDILKKLENHKIFSLILSFLILLITYNYKIYEKFRGFPYSGIKLNVASICLFIFFSLIPFQTINKKILYCIKIITSHTGGIYYFQSIIKNILYKIKLLKGQYIYQCVIIYIFGYIICFIGTRIFKKNRLKYLFN